MSTVELYRRYRPSNLNEIIGQPEAVSALKKMISQRKIPHAILFSGPSGVGKTTISRILKEELQCSNTDYSEINCATERGIDMVRDIEQGMRLSPMQGKCRIYLLDEAHQLTRRSGGDAQTAILKLLEDTPSHVYFILCTTHPNQLLKTIQTRCTPIHLSALPSKAITELITKVAKKEKIGLTEEVIERLTECAEGSARKALVLLHKIMGLEDEDERLNAIGSSDAQKQAIDLVKALIQPYCKWAEIARVLKSIDEEPEEVRRLVLAYCSSVILSGGKLAPRAYLIVRSFEANFYDSGRAGLVAACWDVVNQGK
jgi:DNA polymerase-3 subunit gamma/tau